MSLQPLVAPVITLGLGAAGAFLADAAYIPAPYLVGPALVVTLAGLLGLKLTVPIPLRNLCFLVVGLSMGASVTPDVLEAARAWPASFLMVFVTSVILLFSAYAVLKRIFGYDHLTALLSACPGHLSYVLSLAAGMKSDLVSVSLIQSIRVLALTLFVPLIVEVGGAVASEVSVLPTPVSLTALALMAVAAAALGFIFQRLRVPAAILVGGMVVSITSHASGAVAGPIPQWLQIPVYIALGSMIGTRFSGVALADVRKALFAGGSVTLLVGFLSAVIATGISRLLDIPLAATLIAFAPGGLETMAAMAVIMHADPTYVGTHHILRLIFLSVLMPFIIARASRR